MADASSFAGFDTNAVAFGVHECVRFFYFVTQRIKLNASWKPATT